MNTQVEVLVNGKPIKQHQHEGKTFIEARVNTEYTIKVKNSSGKRKLAVITVDGLNVISGNPHSDTDRQGYIVGAYDSLEVKGFRKDMKSVGAFKFCQAGGSYCNEKGLKGNNGIIGIRVYDEVVKTVFRSPMWGNNNRYGTEDNHYKGSPSIPNPYDITFTCNNATSTNYSSEVSDSSVQCSSLRSMNMKSSAAPKFDVGTTWGKEINDSVINVEFEPTTHCDEYVIYYDSKGNLENMGIKFVKEKQVHYPKAFGTFATPPKGWQG